MRRYLFVVRRPGALRPFVSAVLARLPISMCPLGILILVEDTRGSYAIAGMVAAAFTLGAAVGGPGWGALIDRIGQTRVILPLVLVSAASLVALTLSAIGTQPQRVLVGLAFLVGLTFPPISPGMRGVWRSLLSSPEDRQAAYALEAVAIELMFVSGPLLVALMLFVSPVAPLLLTAALLAGGGAVYALSPPVRTWRAVPHEGAGRRGASPVTLPAVLAAMSVGALIAVGFGNVDVALAAIAKDLLGNQQSVSLLYLALAGGSTIGGAIYGARIWPGAERLRLPLVAAAFSAGLLSAAALVATDLISLWIFMPLLFVVGLFIAPSLIIIANLIDHSAPPDRLGEGQAWLNTAITTGVAVGTFTAGILIDRQGPGLALSSAGLALAATAVIAVGAQRLWAPHDPTRPAIEVR